MVCLTEDYRTAREKCVIAQLTSDLNTDETDVEWSKSRARRQKSLFQEIDAVTDQRDDGATASMSIHPHPSP